MNNKPNSAMAMRPNIASEQDGIALGELFHSLWRGKLWIAVCALIGLLLGGYYAYFVAVPVYTSTAVVMLDSRKEQVVDLESVMSGLGGDQIAINTEVEVIRSRGLIEKLVVSLDLLDDPEFNKTLVPEPTLSLRRLRGLFSSAVPVPPSAREVLDAVIDTVLMTISVSNVRQSYVFLINATTEDREKSAQIANTLSDLYILEQVEVKFDATEKATKWLSERVGKLQVSLEKAVAAAKEYNAGTELISPETLMVLNRQLKETRDRLRDTNVARAIADQRLAELRAASASGVMQDMADAAGDSSLMVLSTKSGNREAFDSAFDQILKRAEVAVARLANQSSTLESAISTQEDQIRRQSADLVTLEQLEREAEASRLIYEYFLNRLKETSIQQGIQQPDSRRLSVAATPLNPSAPRRSLVMMISLMLGMMIGAAVVLGRELAHNTFRLGEDLEKKTGYPVLGQIPAIPAGKRSEVLKYLVDRPTSAIAESVRNLRTSVLLSDLDNPPKIIMSTSSVAGEGKTTNSLALAQNLGSMGKKVLLIEGDMRKRIFAEYFDIKNQKGLMSVLSGEMKFEDVVIFQPLLNADMLVAEKTSTNPADVYSSERFRHFLSEQREKYDYIIIDTPPVLAVPDARVIGQSVDAILYTVRWDYTSQPQVREGIRSFEGVNLKIAGLVLSQISGKALKRYGYGDYSSYYDG